MLLNIAQIINLANALQPAIVGAVVGVEHVIGALKGAVPELEVDDDLRALIVEALAAKAEADRAASGNDPR